MKSYCVFLALLSFSLSVLLVQCQEMGTVPVTQEFTDAIDSGMQDVITDTSFSFQYYKLMLFNVPAIEICTTRAKYPTKNPFIGRTQLNMCIELGTIYPHYEGKLIF